MGKIKNINISVSALFLVIAVLIGGYIRLIEVIDSPSPLNDGGLFYTMTQNLIANGFRLPKFSSYNQLNIPFTYPPLGFYLAGLLQIVTHFDLFDIIRVLPAIFSIASIPAFYILAKKFLDSDIQVGLATLIFTLTPATFGWLVMGGGLTRSPGFFFSILTINAAFSLFKDKRRFRTILLTAFFASLTVLTHPEASIHTAAAALVLFLFYGRNKEGVLRSFVVAIIIILLASPWWFNSLSIHGLSPLISANKVGLFDLSQIIRLFTFNFTDEYVIQISSVLGLLGLFLLLAKKQNLLPALFIVIFLSAPRSSWRYLSILISIMASYFLIFLTNTIDEYKRTSLDRKNEKQELFSIWSKILLASMLILWIFNSFTTIFGIRNEKSLTQADLDAFAWINANTPDDSQFLVVTGKDPLFDPFTEWFPALTARKSIATVYGREWLNNENFNVFFKSAKNLQSCIDKDLRCIDKWLASSQDSIDFLVIRQLDCIDEPSQETVATSLIFTIEDSPEYKPVYRTDEISIYQKKE